MKRILPLFLALGLTGCAGQLAYWNSLSPGQQIQLATTIINGVCVATAVGSNLTVTIDTIVHTTPGSVAGTATKVGAISAATCAAYNGVIATVSTSKATVVVGG